MSTSMPIDTGPGPTSKESATSGTADRPFPLKKKSPFTATKTSGKLYRRSIRVELFGWE